MRRTQWLKLVHEMNEYHLISCKKVSSNSSTRSGGGKSYKKCVQKAIIKTSNKIRKMFSFVSENGTKTKTMTLVAEQKEVNGPEFDLPEAVYALLVSQIPATKDNIELLKTLAGTCSFFHTLASSSIEKYNKDIFLVHLRDLIKNLGREAEVTIRFIGNDHREHTIQIVKVSRLNQDELNRLLIEKERDDSNDYSFDTEDDAQEDVIDVSYRNKTTTFIDRIFGSGQYIDEAATHVASIIGIPQKIMISNLNGHVTHELSSIPIDTKHLSKKTKRNYEQYMADSAQRVEAQRGMETTEWFSPAWQNYKNSYHTHSKAAHTNPIVKKLPALREEAWKERITKKSSQKM